MDLNEFAVDTSAEEDGVIYMLSAECGVKLRSAASKHAREAIKRIWKPYRSFRDVSDDLDALLSAKMIVEGFVVRWVGTWLLDGQALDTADKARMVDVLRQPRLRPLRQRLSTFANNPDNFRDLDDTEIALGAATGPAADAAALGN